MTWSANLSGHAEDAALERQVLDVLENAVAEIRGILGPGDYGSYYSQHHGSGRLHGPDVSTQDDPAPGTGGATPGGPGIGAGGATGGGDGSGGGD